MLFPVIKVLAKNAVSPFCKYIEDQKLVAVIFNTEIFHAYFVSMCMQSATSLRSTMLLMLMDVVHAWLSLRDINLMMDENDATRAKLTANRQRQCDTDVQSKALADLPAHVLFLVKAVPKLLEVGNIRLQTRSAMRNPAPFSQIKVSRMVVPKGIEEIEQSDAVFGLSRLEPRFPEAEQKLLLQILDVKARSKCADDYSFTFAWLKPGGS